MLPYSFSRKVTGQDNEEIFDLTSPNSDGSVISHIVALSQAVKSQAEILNSLKYLPQVVQELQAKLIPIEQPDIREVKSNQSEHEVEEVVRVFDGVLPDKKIQGKPIFLKLLCTS